MMALLGAAGPAGLLAAAGSAAEGAGATLFFIVAIGLYFVGGGLSLWVALGHRDWIERPAVAWGGAALFFLLLGLSVTAIRLIAARDGGAGPEGIMLGAVGVTWGVFMAHAAGSLFMAVRRRATSDSNIPEIRTYDQAEAAERRRDWETAERLYKAALAEDPSDLETRRRLGELAIRRGDLEAALRIFQSVLPRIPEREKKLALAFRMADLMAGPGKDPGGARVLLESLAHAALGTPEEEGWRRRIAELPARGQ